MLSYNNLSTGGADNASRCHSAHTAKDVCIKKNSKQYNLSPQPQTF